MKNLKSIISRSLISAPIGVTIGLIFALIFCQVNNLPQFTPSTENFVSLFANPVQATFVSMIIWALMGAIYGGSSVIFEQERWSITRQTFSHFLITYILVTPLSILAGMPFNLTIFLGYTLNYCVVYLIIWLATMFFSRRMAEQLNEKIPK